MIRVRFEKTLIPCVLNEVISWHLEHGWVWDAVEFPSRRRCAVLYCTLLCGDGCIIHFETVPGIRVSHLFLLSGMRRAMRMIAPVCGVIYATIPEEKRKLIRVAEHLGFRRTDADFDRDGVKICMLKYLKEQ